MARGRKNRRAKANKAKLENMLRASLETAEQQPPSQPEPAPEIKDNGLCVCDDKNCLLRNRVRPTPEKTLLPNGPSEGVGLSVVAAGGLTKGVGPLAVAAAGPSASLWLKVNTKPTSAETTLCSNMSEDGSQGRSPSEFESWSENQFYKTASEYSHATEGGTLVDAESNISAHAGELKPLRISDDAGKPKFRKLNVHGDYYAGSNYKGSLFDRAFRRNLEPTDSEINMKFFVDQVFKYIAEGVKNDTSLNEALTLIMQLHLDKAKKSGIVIGLDPSYCFLFTEEPADSSASDKNKTQKKTVRFAPPITFIDEDNS